MYKVFFSYDLFKNNNLIGFTRASVSDKSLDLQLISIQESKLFSPNS